MRLVVDEAHFTHVVARFEHRQNDFATTGVSCQHPSTAIQQDEKRVALAALLHHQFTAAEAAFDDTVCNRLSLVCGEQRKQRYAADQVQVGQHRHGKSPLVLLRPIQHVHAGLVGAAQPKHACLQESGYCAHWQA